MSRKRRLTRSEMTGLRTVGQIANQFGVHCATVYRWIARGELHAEMVKGMRLARVEDIQSFRSEYFEELAQDTSSSGNRQ